MIDRTAWPQPATLPSAPAPANQRRQGFALIITILLMAFLVLLMVSMASLTRVETQIAFNQQQAESARHNALTALNIAIGQLQAAAGPDQRVTARADILDSGSTTLRKVSGSLEQPLWTGVWKTGSASLDIANSGVPQRQTSLGSTTPSVAQKVATATWLVSNPTPATPVDPTTYVGTATNSVDLATKVGPSQNITVTVPLVPLTATPTGFGSPQTIGQYGYWVSDEGVKAKVNIGDPTAQKTYSGTANLDPVTDLPTNLLHFSAPQALAAHKILPDTLATDFRGAPNIDRVLVPQQLAFLPATAPNDFITNKYIADITTNSFGVLADARKGGLKKDLTAAFEDSGASTATNYGKLNPDGTARVYLAPTDTVPLIPSAATAPAPTTQGLDGLRWVNLFTYYNLYKSTFPAVDMGSAPRVTNARVSSAGYVPGGIGNPGASGRPYAIAPRGHAWWDTTLGISGTADYNKLLSFGTLAPVVLGLRWDVSVGSVSTTGGWTLSLNYYPQLILYNPYGVTLHAPLNNLRYSKALAAAGNFYLETTVGSGGSAKTYFTMVNQAAVLQRILLTAGFDDMQTFKPGEIRVFGLNAAYSGTQVDSTTNVIASQNYSKTATDKMTALTVACEIKDTASPYGMLSKGYASNYSRSAAMQVITTLGTLGTTPDTYGPLPPQPAGTPISIRLVSSRPAAVNTAVTGMMNTTISGSGSSDNSIPRALYWPCDNAMGGAVLGNISGRTGSDGGRFGQGGSPGSLSTGAGGSIGAKPVLTAQIDTLGEIQVLSLYIRKKGINATGGSSYTNASLAVPYFNGNSTAFNPINDFNGSRYWDELYIANPSSWPSYPTSGGQAQTDITAAGHTTTSWGDRSTGEATPANSIGSRIILADVPVQPMLSLGQFMHLQQYHMFSTGNYTSLGFGSMFVGGSINCPEIPTTQSAYDNVSLPTNSSLLMDHSFLANQALFDSYYFSTMPPAGSAPSGTTWPTQWTAFNSANSGTKLTDASKLLLNSRMVPIYTNGQAPLLADLRDMDSAAANLLLNGAFNINSTSVDAWRALLSSLSGNDLSLWDATSETAQTLSSSQLLNPLTRFWSANGGGSFNTLWSGVRALSDTEVTNLATEIVGQIKARGPFLSMADFLNRRLGSNSSDLARAGALQAAIDRTTLNDNVKASGVAVTGITGSVATAPIVKPIPGNMLDASSTSGAAWNSTIGAPGYLMQQDLVQAFSSVMAARSDTFVIRTYGAVVNPATSKTESKAWLEAVVQRLPEFVDRLDPALSALGAATPVTAVNATNQNFGRRFKIISMRWLSPNEI